MARCSPTRSRGCASSRMAEGKGLDKSWPLENDISAAGALGGIENFYALPATCRKGTEGPSFSGGPPAADGPSAVRSFSAGRLAEQDVPVHWSVSGAEMRGHTGETERAGHAVIDSPNTRRDVIEALDTGDAKLINCVRGGP